MRQTIITRLGGLGLAAALAATIALGAPAPAGAAPASTTYLAQGAPQEGVKVPAGRLLVRALVRATADATGQKVADVRAALLGGQSLAQIAAAGGSSGDAVVQAVVDKARERLDRAVAKGRISAERADEAIEKLTEAATRIVNDTGLGAKLAARQK